MILISTGIETWISQSTRINVFASHINPNIPRNEFIGLNS